MKRKVKEFKEPETITAYTKETLSGEISFAYLTETPYGDVMPVRIVRESDWRRILKLARGK